jgi:soluble lytic murein transglycosylase
MLWLSRGYNDFVKIRFNFNNIALTACALLLACAPLAARAAPSAQDAAVLAAFDAYRAGDPWKLAKLASAFKGHVLAPYYDYWRLALRLDDSASDEIQAYLAANAGSYTADRLRAEWLRVLGRKREWQRFDQELGPLVRDDLDLRCYAWSSRLARGDNEAISEAMAAWSEPRELPAGCTALVDTLFGQSALSEKHVWQRTRLLFEANQITAAKTALAYLPKAERPDETLLQQAAMQPRNLLDRGGMRGNAKRATRELLVLATLRLAQVDPRGAAATLSDPRSALAALEEDDRAYLWGRLGYEAARRHYDEALDWYARAGKAKLSDEALAWRTRAALRRGDWQVVRDAIDAMSPLAARTDPAWSYWYGRALAVQGNTAGAHAYYQRVASQPDFYGLLAAEELGFVSAIPQPPHVPSEADVAAARSIPGIARALELYRLGMRTEATREWVFTIRTLEDTQLLAVAEAARRAELYDRAINTADRTVALHNFGLRYLTPFRDLFGGFARNQGLDEHWVFGLVRQESRFIVDAKSVAGAQGLMQLMPATARWVAQKIGHRDFDPRQVVDVKTNISLGTGYLKMVLDDLGHAVLASAAYNAGPGRARRWRDEKSLEGAVYAETIPFNETRDYVKKVMANAVLYATVLQGKAAPLKQRLGIVAGRAKSDRFNEELP